MANKTYQTMFALGAKVNSSFNRSFNQAINNMSRVQKQASATNRVFSSMGSVITKTIGLIGTVATLKSISDKTVAFQDQMADVATLIDGDVTSKIAKMGSQVKKTAIDTGVGTELLTSGLYQVVSAFGESEDAMKKSTIAAIASKAGNSSVTDAVNLLAAVTKGYGDTSMEATQKASDLAFLTVKLGQTTFPELAASMGKVIPISATLGVKQEELFGAMASLTGVTGNTAEVTTQLRGALQAFIQPTKQMDAALKNLGYQNGQAALKSEGLESILQKLRKVTGKNEVAFANLFGSIEAKTAVLALTGSQAQNFTEKTKAMNNAIGATEKAFRQKSGTIKTSMARIQQIVNVAAINIGEKAMPLVEKGLDNVMKGFTYFKDTVAPQAMPYLTRIGDAFKRIYDNVFPNVQQFGDLKNNIVPGLLSLLDGMATTVEWVADNWSLVEPVIIGVTAAIIANTAAVKGAFIISALTTAWSIATTAMGMYQAGASLATIAQWALNAAMTANPIGVVIVAIGALIAAGYALYKNWNKVSGFFIWIWNGLKNTVVNVATSVWEFLKKWGALILLPFAPFLAIPILIVQNWEKIKEGAIALKDGLVGIFANIAEYLGGVFKTPINTIISMINMITGALNKIKIDIPGWIPGIGGKSFGINIPEIPLLAKGGRVLNKGAYIAGERGPELIANTPGATVVPANRTQKLLDNFKRSGNKGVSLTYAPQYIIQGNADIEKIKQLDNENRRDFERRIKRYLANEDRLSFA